MERQRYQKTRYTVQDVVNFVLDCDDEEETDNEKICPGEDQDISNFEPVSKKKKTTRVSVAIYKASTNQCRIYGRKFCISPR